MNFSPLRSLILASLIATLAACGGGGSSPQPTPAPPVPLPIVDTDKDGVPDADDVVPNDPLCSAASDANAGVCYVRSLAGTRLKVVASANGKVYFNSEDDALRLYGYDLLTRHFIGRVSMVGYTPTTYAYSVDHARMYVGDSTGKIHSYSETLEESPTLFASVPTRISGLVAVGKYLMAQDDTGAWASHWIFNKQGIQTDTRDWNYYSSHYDWNQATSTLYFFRDNQSPNDLMFEVIDQATGKIASSGETPYHGDYTIRGPIRSNLAGSKVLLGSGDIYTAPGLFWAGNLGTTLTDGTWLANDELLVLSPAASQTHMVRYSASKTKVEEGFIDGEVMHVSVVGNTNYMVIKRPGQIDFMRYVPSDDSDGDGVPNLTDKFPLDKTASIDSDNDGHPDAFLGSYTAADSPSGLTRDFYPQDANCYALEQGDGVNCNYATVIPAYVPDRVINDEQGIIYLLSKANFRVYRWSVAKGEYISPLVIGRKTSLTNTAPNVMAYSADHNRLYFGYGSGQITYINLSGDTVESNFTAVAGYVNGLAATGKFLLAQDPSGAWNTHYIFDKAGTLLDSKDWNYYSGSYEWNAAQSRIYFFRDDTSPNDLMYETIDQVTGKISGNGETPYHGSYSIFGPIRATAGGGRIVLGSGDVYSGSDLTVVKSFGFAMRDAQWLADGSLVAMTVNGADTNVTLYNASFTNLKNQIFTGTPVALLKTGAGITVVTQVAGKPKMNVFPL